MEYDIMRRTAHTEPEELSRYGLNISKEDAR